MRRLDLYSTRIDLNHRVLVWDIGHQDKYELYEQYRVHSTSTTLRVFTNCVRVQGTTTTNIHSTEYILRNHVKGTSICDAVVLCDVLYML